MRFVVPWVACVGIALFTAGCDPSFYTQGVGTTLYPSDVATQTQLQNAYVGEICLQAGLQPTVLDGVVSCGPNPLDSRTWWLFVQAGMNDIDQRCDKYLAWLDDVQRSREPVLNELALASATAQTIMLAAGVGANPITIVGAAFGFASGTFTNVYSRLIIQLPHSTVQAVVLSRQKEFRDQLIGNSNDKPPVAIISRPTAIYALRSYLRLCMPMTIETEINSTVTTFARSGAAALQKDSLISAQTAGVPFKPVSPVQAPTRAVLVPNPYGSFFQEHLSKQEAEFVLRALCFDKNNEAGITTPNLIKALVGLYEDYRRAENKPVANGVITRTERQEIEAQPDCGSAKNFYEKVTFANTLSATARANSADAISAFSSDVLSRSPAGGAIVPNPSLTSLREKIRAVRAALQLTDVPSAMGDQITPAFIDALKKLPPKAN